MAPIVWPTLLIQPQCPLCHQAWSGHSFCPSCRDQLKLNQPRPQGSQPIPWRALGRYDSGWRQLILGLRRQASPNLIRALATECLALLPKPKTAVVLCAIPPRQGHQPGPPQWIQQEICCSKRDADSGVAASPQSLHWPTPSQWQPTPAKPPGCVFG